MERDLQNIWNSSPVLPRLATRPGLVLGYHGTDDDLAEQIVLRHATLKPSRNRWDWIGHGTYFWEYSPSRALEFANSARKRKGSLIKKAGVIGAVLDLGNCLDLLDYENLLILKEQYEEMKSYTELAVLRNAPLLHDLDCAIVEAIHESRHMQNLPPFDSVRAVFWEGNLLYPNAGFREKNHIQICIRNPNCIKGLFLPHRQ